MIIVERADITINPHIVSFINAMEDISDYEKIVDVVTRTKMVEDLERDISENWTEMDESEKNVFRDAMHLIADPDPSIQDTGICRLKSYIYETIIEGVRILMYGCNSREESDEYKEKIHILDWEDYTSV